MLKTPNLDNLKRVIEEADENCYLAYRNWLSDENDTTWEAWHTKQTYLMGLRAALMIVEGEIPG